MSDPVENFRKNVLRILERRRIKPAQLGKMVERVTETKRRAVTSTLKGEYKSPRFETLSNIARALKVPVVLLFIPDIDLDALESSDGEKFLENLGRVQPETRRYIYHVAEREAQYTGARPTPD